MTTKTRSLVIASLLTLTVGLGAGLVAYYAGFSVGAVVTQGGAPELQFVPADASLVAYVDVHDIMNSALGGRLRGLVPMGQDGPREFESHTGINISTDIDRVVVALMPALNPGAREQGSALVLARGRLDAVKIEALMREHGASVETYRDQRLLVGAGGAGKPLSLAFLEPGLVAVGTPGLIRSSVDLKAGGASVLANDELMALVHDLDAGNAWAVGRFDPLTSQASLPLGLSRLPTIQWFSAAAHFESGVRGVFRADAHDNESATALRDVVRGVLALGRLQVSSQPVLDAVIRSLDLGGTGKTVSLRFDIPAETFDALESLSSSQAGRSVPVPR